MKMKMKIKKMKKGVLLVNLGSPDSPSPKDVKKYLGEFLMDKKVINIPKIFRSILVKGIILNTRPKKSAKAYSKIWWEEGSPLIVLSNRLKEKVERKTSLPLELSMRYGNPSIEVGIKNLVKKGVNEILIFPLYPQFAMATTETIIDLSKKIVLEKFPNIKLKFVESFYKNSKYIKVLSNSISNFLNGKKYEHIVFSYHGIPKKHIKISDITKNHCKIDRNCCSNFSEAHKYCYRHQCYETTNQVAQYLNLNKTEYTTTFQSRVLSKFNPWLEPYTDIFLSKLAKSGTKNVAIVTPAFVSDCLETLEEIGLEAVEDFKDDGGENLHVIPCLNDRDSWVEVISNWLNKWEKQDLLPL